MFKQRILITVHNYTKIPHVQGGSMGCDKDVLINMEEQHRLQRLNRTPPFNDINNHTIHLGCE